MKTDPSGSPLPGEGWRLHHAESPASRAVRPDREHGAGSQADRVLELARRRYRLARTPEGAPFGVLLTGPRIARMFRGDRASLRAELASAYFVEHGNAPSSTALTDALLVLEGEAMTAPAEHVHLRFARIDEGLAIDLGNADGRSVIVTPDGWTVGQSCPVTFRRTELTGELPEPRPGGDMEELRGLLNVSTGSWSLLRGWLVAALFPDIPRPVVYVFGEQGTGKSSATRMLADLIDASPAPLRAPPKDPEEWIVSAAGSAVVALDNLSSIPDWLSDAMCRGVTGGAMVRRRLYADDDLAVTVLQRAILFNAIDLAGIRGDLAERLIKVELAYIAGGRRKTSDEVLGAFYGARARILGALLTLVADVPRELPTVKLEKAPRMADFARVLAAVDQCLESDSLAVYEERLRSVSDDVLEADLVAKAVTEAVDALGGVFAGTAGDLLDQINSDGATKPKNWPSSARAMGGRLRRIAMQLRATGYTVEPPDEERRGATGRREWIVKAPPKTTEDNPITPGGTPAEPTLLEDIE